MTSYLTMAARKRKLAADADADETERGQHQPSKRACFRPVLHEIDQHASVVRRLDDILQKLHQLDQRLRAVEELASYVQQKQA